MSVFVVFLNNVPIYCISKKKTSCKTSMCVSDIVAIKKDCKYVCSLCYNPRMTKIPVEEPTYVYGNNQYVLDNNTMPESTPNNCGAEFGLEYVGKIPLSRVPCMVERSPEEIFGTICAIV